MAQWHPFFVHFTIALALLSGAFLVLGWFARQKPWADKIVFSGHVMLWVCAVLTILTLVAGIDAFNTVSHDTPSHIAMKDHRFWAFMSAALIVLLALWSALSHTKGRAPGAVFLIPVLAMVGLVFVTGGKGARLVFHHGLGVASLPDLGNHDHASAEAHDHGDGSHAHGEMPDGPLAVVRAFHHALDEKDEATVQRLLKDDVLIFESGYAERSFEEYKSHHMPADMAFASETSSKASRTRVFEDGDMALVVRDRHTQGRWNDKDVNSLTLETIVLNRDAQGWRIAHIHWSARSAPDDLGEAPVDDHSDDHEH